MEPSTIHRRSDDDLPSLRVLAEEVLRLDGDPPRRPPDLGRFVSAPEALASFVAVVDGQVVGPVCVSPSSSPAVLALATRAPGQPKEQLAVVARLLVSPRRRRLGIAQGLLVDALAEVSRHGRTPVLDVATHFHKAIALYEHCGWRKVGRGCSGHWRG
jgi:GNAT superfamily N-acetyltransferase